MNTLQVCVFCGDESKFCDLHKHPTLVEDGKRREERKDWAHEIAQEMFADMCMILTNFRYDCTSSDCLTPCHLFGFFSTNDEAKCTQDAQHGTCMTMHSTNVFSNAMTQHVVVISNDPDNDPRIRLPTNHPTMKNCMVVPLISSDNETVGAVALGNIRLPEWLHEDDYYKKSELFDRLAAELKIVKLDRDLKRLRSESQQCQETHTRELRDLSVTRDTFVATMSHEMRTPLNGIVSTNQLLSQTPISKRNVSRIRKWIGVQSQCALQLLELINDILDFCKLRSKSLQLESEPFDIRKLIGQAVDVSRQGCVAKGLEIYVVIDDDVPRELLGDAKRVKQVLLNLINNGVKYTEHGHLKIVVDGESDPPAKQFRLKVRVADTGRGVPKSMQESIFEEFNQIRNVSDSTNTLQGVGLGLAICKELVELMGGDLSVESDGVSGSTFSFVVPLRDSATVNKMIALCKESMAKTPVLVVDDVEENRMVLSQMLSKWSFIPHAVSTAEEALSLLEALPRDYFRVALVDIDLNGSSGAALAQRVLQDGFDQLLLIATSSMGSNFPGKDVFDAVHTKPIHPDELLSTMMTLLSRPVNRTPRLVRRVTTREDRITKTQILIVEDDKNNQLMCGEILKSLGYLRYKCVGDGVEALEFLSKEKVLCVLMDIVMPRMNGIECTRRIRAHPERYGEPVIVGLTADAVDKTRNAAINAGMRYFLCKPVDMGKLQEVLSDILPTPRLARGQRSKRRMKLVRKRVPSQ